MFEVLKSARILLCRSNTPALFTKPMPGSAVLNPLVALDCLIETVDEARQLAADEIGNRAFRVFAVTRVWPSGEVGYGPFSDTEVEITPPPSVGMFDSLQRNQEPCGFDIAGNITLTKVSLTYTADELLSCEAPAGTQYLFRISEAHGQGQRDRYFAHKRPPFPNRECKGSSCLSWTLWLELVDEDC